MEFLRLCYHLSLRISKRFNEDQLGPYAAQAAFFITLSAFPLLIVFLALLRFCVPFSYPNLLQGILDLTPSSLHDLVSHLLKDAYAQSSAAILSLSSLTTLWSASRCVYALRMGLNHIHHIKKRRSYLFNRISSLFYTFGLLLVVLFILLVLIFGNQLQHVLSRQFPVLAQLIGPFISLRGLPAIGILLAFFLCVYALLPDERRSLFSQLPGAMFSTAGWLLLSFGFSLYVEHFSGYSAMYGSLTAIILAMLWVYFCMYLILIGAELNIWLSTLD